MKKKRRNRTNTLLLSEESFESFEKILANQSKPNTALKKAFALHKRVVKQKLKLDSALIATPLKKTDLILIVKKFQLTNKQAAAIGGISVRTYQRWKPRHLLSSKAAEHLSKIVEVYNSGLALFNNDKQSFINWMNEKIPALNYQLPIELMITSTNEADRINDILNGIEYGAVF